MGGSALPQGHWFWWSMLATAALLSAYLGCYLLLRWQHRFVHYALERSHDGQGRYIAPRVVWHAIDDAGVYDAHRDTAAEQSVLIRTFRPLAWCESHYWAARDDDRTTVSLITWPYRPP